MSGLALLAALTLPVLGAPKFTLKADGRTELRLREPADPQAPGEVVSRGNAWDWDVTAAFGFGVRIKRLTIDLAYTPRYTLQNFADLPTSVLLNTGTLTIEYHWRKLAVGVSEIASYGQRSFYTLALAAPGRGAVGAATGGAATPGAAAPPAQNQPQAVPGTLTLTYVSTNTRGWATATLSSRSTLTVGGGYELAGGSDAKARAYLPLTTGPYAWSTWTNQLRRKNQLTTDVTASITGTLPDVGPTVRTSLVTASEAWRKQWARRTTTTLTLGGSATRTLTAGDDDFNVYPGGSAVAVQGFRLGPRPGLLEVTLGVGETVIVDRLTGFADPRWEARAGAGWTFRKFFLYGLFIRAQSVDMSEPNALRITAATFGFRQDLSRLFSIDGGFRLLHQQLRNSTAPAAMVAYTGPLWVQFIGLSVHPEPRDF